MTDQEYRLLDELYFLTSYSALQSTLGCEENALLQTLEAVFRKGWLRVYRSESDELVAEEAAILSEGTIYWYNASKQGLFALNQV